MRRDLPDLPIEKVRSGPRCGDAMIAELVQTHEVRDLHFWADPQWSQPHRPDVMCVFQSALRDDVCAALHLNPTSSESWARRLAA